MQIQLRKNGWLELSDGNVVALVSLNAEPQSADMALEEGTIYMGNFQSLPYKSNLIWEPGEYEVAGVQVTALESKAVRDGTADVFQVSIDGVSVVFAYDIAQEIAKSDWEVMDDVHILVLDLEKEQGMSLDKVIMRFNPYQLVVLNSTAEHAEKAVGIAVKEANKKFKFSDKDFTAEEFVTQLNLLT